MDIKIVCACGTKYAFDVEPVEGQMPDAVQCPACGAEGTAAANEQIREQFATAPTATPTARRAVRIAATSAAVQAVPADLTMAAETDQPVPRCAKHPGEIAAAGCAVCGKPICQLCLEQFGFLCSVYCREQAAKRKLDIPVYEGQKQQVRHRAGRKENRLLLWSAVGVLAIGLGWAGMAFLASKPRLAYTLTTSKSQPFAHAQWVGQDRLVVLSPTKLSLLRAANGKPLWETPLKPDEKIVPGSQGHALQTSGDTIWVALANRAVRVQAQTGQRKLEVPLPPTVEDVMWDETTLIVVSHGDSGEELVTSINLQSGQPRTDQVPGPTHAPVALAISADATREGDPFPLLRHRSEFRPSGGGAAQLSARMVQARRVAGAPLAGSDAPSVLDKANLRAGDSTEATQQFLRNSAEVFDRDESRYAVTLRRFGGGAAGEWTRELVGRPAFFPQKTVDVLVAGTNVTVLNRNNQVQWEARLNYPIHPQTIEDADLRPAGPALEIAGRLYLFDLGVLTAFERRNGQVAWRLPAVHVSEVQPDGNGRLYVVATTAGPEAIYLKDLSKIGQPIQPLLLKVDAATGKVLWQQERLAEHTLVSGKYLYSARAQTSGLDMLAAALNGGTSNTIHYRVWRLDPKSGQMLWEYYQPRPPIRAEAQQRRLLLQYPDEVQVLKLMAL
jgi:hypothetical protein